ncbi:MAG: glycosyltransferase family A protein [Bacteroidota bacterium]|nr:glycosyltransferase family A protein [Bacteroidota bacterium]
MEQPDTKQLISVIIPVYNRENNVLETLNSLVEQTYRPIELILVDNGSTDGSLEICRKFQTRYDQPAFRVIVTETLRHGANAARNKGFKLSSGDYLLFFDSDDRWYPDSLSIIFSNLYKHHFPEAIAFSFLLRFPDGHVSRRPHHHSSSPAEQLFDPVLSTHNVCLRRSLFIRIGLWNEQLIRWQDLEFGFRILKNVRRLYWIKGAPLYEVSVHQDSISGKTYSSDFEALSSSLESIQQLVETMPSGRTSDHLQRALCFKKCSVAAQIRLEQQTDRSAEELYQTAVSQLPTSRDKLSRSILWLHFWYSGRGGRGFWRLARKFL